MATCPLCKSDRLRAFLLRNSVPVHQNAPMKTMQAARELARGTLSLVCCESCGFIHNEKFDLKKLAYGTEYDNAQIHSAVFRDHVAGLTSRLLHQHQVRDCRIVEIGCGDGYFLRQLVEQPSLGNFGIGFDPSYTGPISDGAGRLRFERRYFDADCADVEADVVVCRHVIEHVPDPLAMLCAVGQALRSSPNARVFFETPCVEWILAENVIWDFFYEHCSYFSASSLRTIFEAAGFSVDRVDHVFDQQYLWIEARLASSPVVPTMEAGTIPQNAARFGDKEKKLLAALREKSIAIAEDRRLAIWGAGAKGVTLANLVDPDRQIFDCAIDINPNKQGLFVGGTGHAILSLQQARERGVSAAILTNPNYRTEIDEMIQSGGTPFELVDVDW